MSTQTTPHIDYSRTPPGLTGHVLQRKGCPLHYWVGGPEGRPLVVLMHGATMDHRMFNPQVQALTEEYRLLVWDARGHGQSQPIGEEFTLEGAARDMLAILEAQGVEQAAIGGQSLGGIIAQLMYRIEPGRFSAMIGIDTVPIARPYNGIEVWALKASLPLFDVWPYKNFTRVVANRTVLDPEAQAYAHGAINQMRREDFLAVWKAVTVAVTKQGLPGHKVDVPLFMAVGDKDATGTVKRDMPWWAAYEDDVTFHVIPQASHNANQDNPAFFNRVLLEFLQEKVG